MESYRLQIHLAVDSDQQLKRAEDGRSNQPHEDSELHFAQPLRRDTRKIQNLSVFQFHDQKQF